MSKDGIEYEVEQIKKTKNAKQIALKELDRIGTPSIIWHLVKRHKFGLVVAWAVAITLNTVAPYLPDAIFNLFA